MLNAEKLPPSKPELRCKYCNKSFSTAKSGNLSTSLFKPKASEPSELKFTLSIVLLVDIGLNCPGKMYFL